MILVDTSVWIDFLNGRDTSHRLELHRLIENGNDLSIGGIILQEILQGIRSDIDLQKTSVYLANFNYCTLREPGSFELAAKIYRTCRQKGKTIRKPLDCLIAALALENDLALFHNDTDFLRIAEVVPLKIHSVK